MPTRSRHNRPNLLLVATLLLAAALVPGSGAGLEAQAPRGAFQFGVQQLSTTDLDAALVSADLPAFDNTALTLGGFGFGSIGRLLIGGEGHGLVPLEETTADGRYRTRLAGGYGFFNLGVKLLSTESLDLYPLLGVGGGATELEVIERISPTFDDVLGDPGTSSTLTGSTFLFSASIGADYRLGASRGGRGRNREDAGREGGGLFIGVRAGWIFAPGDTQWQLNGLNDVAGGPATVTEGGFLRVSIGGVRRSRH